MSFLKKKKCDHNWGEGILVDAGRNKLWVCSKCNKIKTLFSK